MKRFAALLGLAIAVVLPPARAQQNPDDQYIALYSLMQQADALQAGGQPRQALAGYTQALAGLQKFQKLYSDRDPTIVSYRLNYLTGKVKELAAQYPPIPNGGTPPTAPSTSTSANAPANPTPLAANSSSAADAEAQLNALRAQVQSLQSDNETLQAKLKEALRAQPAPVDAQELAKSQAQVLSLMKENDLLRASMKTGATNGTAPDELQKVREALADANQKLAVKTASVDDLSKSLAALQSDASINALEKAALEDRLRQRQAAPPAPAAANDEVKTLRARLAVDEAQAVPYTPEEQALLKSPAPAQAASSADQKKSIGELPAGSALLVTEAQNYFLAGQYDKAEADYRQILQGEPNNALALGNLATIELQENKLADAETHLTAALAQTPDDAYSLATLGFLKFRQQKYDDSLDALSRAAKLDPANPQIQNYLGVTLSQKGLRAQAETALRKAVELAPNYGSAHNNLAVIYLGEKPPMAELARWHYQKALELGEPRNPDQEKKLADLGVPVAK
jgi:tetratricopeptide (TPR) repeat protein